MSKHHKPDYESHPQGRHNTARTTEGTARDAGRKLLLFAAAAIVIVVGGVYWLMRS